MCTTCLTAFAACLTIAAPAAAQETAAVTLAPGESVTVRIDDGGVIGAPERGRAEWTPYDIAAARHLSGIPTPGSAVPYATPLPRGGGIPAEPAVEPGRLQFKFLSIAGRHSLLAIENGYAQALAYRARMTRGDQTRTTDVCIVIPGRHGYEHWPHTIDRLELSDFRFVAWRPGDPVPCQ